MLRGGPETNENVKNTITAIVMGVKKQGKRGNVNGNQERTETEGGQFVLRTSSQEESFGLS